MWELKTHSGFPPGGWIYFQPETGWSAPMPMADNFQQTVNRIIQHRMANPRFKLSTDYSTVAEQLEIYTCTRIGFNPSWCQVKKKHLKPQPKSLVSKLLPKGVAAGLAEVAKLSRGAATLADWLGNGGLPVSRLLAQERANKCLQCPLNDLGEWSYTDDIAERIKAQREAKTGLNLKVDNEDKLGVCGACGCNLSLKVWVPLQTIKDHTDAGTHEKLVPECWIKTETKENFLIVIPFCSKDYNQAYELVQWIRELGGARNHKCLLVTPNRMSDSEVNKVYEIAKHSFASVQKIKTPKDLPNEAWPIGPNWMFETTLRHVYQNYRCPFYWMEPDCIPLKPGWADTLQREYDKHSKPFMGAIVHSSGQPNLPGNHLTGCAVYPNNAHELLNHIYGSSNAFDMDMADIVVPLSHSTNKHFHWWGQKELAPTFRGSINKNDPVNVMTMNRIPKEAVVMHRCKDGSLIKLLRAMR